MSGPPQHHSPCKAGDAHCTQASNVPFFQKAAVPRLAVCTCRVCPILFCPTVHQDAKCLQPDIRVSTLNSSAGKLAIAQKGDRIAPEVALTLAVYTLPILTSDGNYSRVQVLF